MFAIKPKYIGTDGIAIFTTTQIDDYGLPENNGWTDRYYVVESREIIGRPTYEQETHLMMDRTPIHRYSRTIRFKSILGQLVGHTGFVTRRSKEMLQSALEELTVFEKEYTPPCMVWETIRSHLKNNKRQIFYNRIPAIAAQLKLADFRNITTTKQIANILDDFESMHEIFGRIRHKLQRRYFPNLRFTALKLMEKHGVKLPIAIPMTRTNVKKIVLEKDFEKIWECIREEYINTFTNIFD